MTSHDIPELSAWIPINIETLPRVGGVYVLAFAGAPNIPQLRGWSDIVFIGCRVSNTHVRALGVGGDGSTRSFGKSDSVHCG